MGIGFRRRLEAGRTVRMRQESVSVVSLRASWPTAPKAAAAASWAANKDVWNSGRVKTVDQRLLGTRKDHPVDHRPVVTRAILGCPMQAQVGLDDVAGGAVLPRDTPLAPVWRVPLTAYATGCQSLDRQRLTRSGAQLSAGGRPERSGWCGAQTRGLWDTRNVRGLANRHRSCCATGQFVRPGAQGLPRCGRRRRRRGQHHARPHLL